MSQCESILGRSCLHGAHRGIVMLILASTIVCFQFFWQQFEEEPYVGDLANI